MRRTAPLAGTGGFPRPLRRRSATLTGQHAARHAFDPLADKIKGLVKQVDLLYKLAARCGQLAQELASVEEAAEFHDRRLAGKRAKQLDEERKQAVEQLKAAAYFHQQIGVARALQR
ncbi:MAG: hypothetical protein U1F70_01965 [Candidatus Competibacteraceae bacterium]